jgi:MFS family permease
MYSFGLSRTFTSLVISRCLNGALNGNIGVLKSQFGSLFDESNMAQAYAYLPLAWSTGSTLGPMIGGALSRPADRFPHIFGHSEFLKQYPYFLPCAVPATFAAIAWVISFIFLKETVESPVSIHRLLFRWRSAEANLVLQNVVEGQDVSVACEPQPAGTESTSPSSSSSSVTGVSRDEADNKPYPLRALLTKDVILAGGNYALLSLVDIAYRGVLPLFFATPKELGGLGLEPPQIGSVRVYDALSQSLAHPKLADPVSVRTSQRHFPDFLFRQDQ